MSMTPLPPWTVDLAASREHAVLLETTRFGEGDSKSYLFLDPLSVLAARVPEEVAPLLERIDGAAAEGLFVAGFMSYEAGYALEPAAGPRNSDGLLAWFGVFSHCHEFDHRTGSWNSPPPPSDRLPYAGSCEIGPAAFDISEEEYRRHARNVLRKIREGDVYQVNYTMMKRFTVTGDDAALYNRLKRVQPVGYGALIRCGGGRSLISLSPELFFRMEGGSITARPMKGTVRRGRTLTEDGLQARWLHNDEKNRAENLMIVDLLRNDLGKIALTGSVRVPSMFDVERYGTVFQMTSTVEARLPERTGAGTVLANLFPCGSITGAPKIAAMKIIAAEEHSARGPYTGAIGFAGPRGAQFNVAIRTIHRTGDNAELGVGGGIVADSNPADEYRECLLKSSFLTVDVPEFELIETLRWEDGFALADLHMQRLRESAEYFGFPFDAGSVHGALEGASRFFASGIARKIRLLLSSSGAISISSDAIPPSDPSVPVTISRRTVQSADRFLFHKTTNRALYDEEFRSAQAAGLGDILYFNERGELTEGAVSNVIVEKDGLWFTPPVACGLLGGVYRAHLLMTESRLSETIITRGDLFSADKLYICNAVRGLREARLGGA